MSAQSAPDHSAEFQSVVAALGHFLGGPVLGAVVRAEIAEQLEAGARTAEELATFAGLHPLSTRRILRFLSAFGIFQEIEPNRFISDS